MMKARKPKRYAEGGDVANQTPMKLVMPSAGYMPGKSAEHMYFQPDTAKIEAAATAAADAAAAAPAASTNPVDINANTSASGSESGGNAKGGLIKMKKMAKGGAVKSSRGDGCAMKGKTKGRMV
jgi:hypothetical protein